MDSNSKFNTSNFFVTIDFDYGQNPYEKKPFNLSQAINNIGGCFGLLFAVLAFLIPFRVFSYLVSLAEVIKEHNILKYNQTKFKLLEKLIEKI